MEYKYKVILSFINFEFIIKNMYEMIDNNSLYLLFKFLLYINSFNMNIINSSQTIFYIECILTNYVFEFNLM